MKSRGIVQALVLILIGVILLAIFRVDVHGVIDKIMHVPVSSQERSTALDSATVNTSINTLTNLANYLLNLSFPYILNLLHIRP